MCNKGLIGRIKRNPFSMANIHNLCACKKCQLLQCHLKMNNNYYSHRTLKHILRHFSLRNTQTSFESQHKSEWQRRSIRRKNRDFADSNESWDLNFDVSKVVTNEFLSCHIFSPFFLSFFSLRLGFRWLARSKLWRWQWTLVNIFMLFYNKKHKRVAMHTVSIIVIITIL